MRALMVSEPGKWALTDIDKPHLKDNHVLIRSKAVGICKSDLEVMDGSRPEPYVSYPIVIGHEFAGIVEGCGRDVSRFKEGDRVVAEPWWHCDICGPCMEGRTNLCEDYNEIGFTQNGGLGELLVVHEKIVHRVPEGLSFNIAAMVEPVACSVQGLFRAGIEPGKKIAVIGPGPIGLICVELCKLFSPSEIVLFGTRDDRLEVGKRMGATKIINLKKENIDKYYDGFDYVIESAGILDAVLLSISLGKRGSTVILLGVIGGGTQVPLVTDDIVFKDMGVIGSVAYTKSSFAKALNLLSNNLIDVSPIITHEFSLNDFNEAIQTVNNRKDGALKVLVRM